MRRDGRTNPWYLILVLSMALNLSLLGSAHAISFSDILDQVGSTLDTVNTALGGKTYTETKDAAQGNALFGGVFGKWEQSWELSMGKEGHESLKQKPGLSKDRNMLARLGDVARRLVPTVERQDLQYHFAVLKTDEVNAFALPGGYVYVTEGLMKQLANNDELAGVVAHELAHVNKKHGVKQAEKAGLMTVAVALMGLNDKAKKYQAAAAVAAFFANLKFSRDDEFEADKSAVNYTHKAGYNPGGLVTFFNKINKDSKLSKVTKYFSTHPPTTERIDRVNKQIRALGGTPVSTQVASSEPVQTGNTPTTSGTDPYANVPGIGNNGNDSGSSSGVRYTNADLKAAYESYLFYKSQYEYAVSQGLPVEQVMAALKRYQAARERYYEIKAAMGR